MLYKKQLMGSFLIHRKCPDGYRNILRKVFGMKLRNLKKKDAPLMYEWMHNQDIVQNLNTDFGSKTLEDCEQFIMDSNLVENHLHLAIVDEDDIYMGTVSLKQIDKAERIAEFAITIRSCAMGKGFSQYGMKEILRIGMEELNLEAIYWCVSVENRRAVRFYDKNQYHRTKHVPDSLLKNYDSADLESFIWYKAENRGI